MKQSTFLILFCMLLFSLVYAQDITLLSNLPGVRVTNIDVTTPWNNTGININVGDTCLIFVKGVAATNGATTPNTIFWLGPEGMGDISTWQTVDMPLPGATQQSVIAKIGESNQLFYVGSNCSFVANVSGILNLGLNDNTFWDNYGYYVAYVFRQPPPIVVNVASEFAPISEKFNLSQNYPNPFNPSTSINFEIPTSSHVRIEIYDINGQKIRDLINNFKEKGNYNVSWDGKDNYGNLVSTGSYFYQIQIDNSVQTKKMIMLK